MKPEGVNRVVIAVRDLDKGIALYSELLGATFHEVGPLAEPFGVRAAFSWDAGIEICAPLPGRDSPMKQSIEQQGEGLVGVVFGVENVDEARERAEKLNIRVSALIEYDQGQIRQYLQDRFKKYKQYMLKAADTYGVRVILGQIEAK